MASDLMLSRGQLERAYVVRQGKTIAAINDPTGQYRAEIIERVRSADIDKELFAKHMALFASHFGASYDADLLRHYYDLLNESMCTEEFIAAARDAFRAKLYKTELIAFLSEHVRRQREDGPDLMKLSMAEIYKRGQE